MSLFAVWRSQDTQPFAALDAPDGASAIQAIKDLDMLGELGMAGYWGSEDETAHAAKPATNGRLDGK